MSKFRRANITFPRLRFQHDRKGNVKNNLLDNFSRRESAASIDSGRHALYEGKLIMTLGIGQPGRFAGRSGRLRQPFRRSLTGTSKEDLSDDGLADGARGCDH